MLVSNASTLILLAKVTALPAFLQEVREVTIPEMVREELLNKESFDALLIKKEIEKRRIKIAKIQEKSYLPLLREFKLHKGEAAAYGLWKQKKGKAILTDDGELIKLCRLEETPFITAMAAIVQLFKRKKFSRGEAEEKIDLLYKHGWYSSEVYQYFRNQIN